MGKRSSSHGKKRTMNQLVHNVEDETKIIDVLDLEKQLDFRLTTDERWALQATFGPPCELSDEDKRKARKIVKALSRELSQVNFGKRLVFASMQDEVPIEKHAALLPYALPKAPTEVEMTVKKVEEYSDEELNARIRELESRARLIDITPDS